MSQGERFRRRALRRGYKVEEVDSFLDRVEATLSGEPEPEPVSSQQVHDVVFRVRFGGYDEWQVDLHLDRVERQLAEREERSPARGDRSPAPGRAASPPVSPDRPVPVSGRDDRVGRPVPPPPLPTRPVTGAAPEGFPRYGDATSGGAILPTQPFGAAPARAAGQVPGGPVRGSGHGSPAGAGFDPAPPPTTPPGGPAPAGTGGYAPPGRGESGGYDRVPPADRDAGFGRDPGQGRDSGFGRDPGQGRDSGFGRDPGMGRDRGRGGGFEPAPGRAPGGGPRDPGFDPRDPRPPREPGFDPRGPRQGRDPGFDPGTGRGYAPGRGSDPTAGFDITAGLDDGRPAFDGFEAGRHGKADMTTEIRMPAELGPPPPGSLGSDMRRVDELRRSFQPRRFGSGYDPRQVDRLFEGIMSAMSGRSPVAINDAELDPGQFDLVPGGYFEAEVDQALREVRDMIRRH